MVDSWILRPLSDESFADLQEEILGFRLGLLDGGPIVAMFKHDFLGDQLNRVFGFVARLYQFPGAIGEAGAGIGFDCRQARFGSGRVRLWLAKVIVKFCGREPIVGAFRFFPAKKSRNRELPLATGTGPAGIGIALHPDQRSRAFRYHKATSFGRAPAKSYGRSISSRLQPRLLQ